MNDEVRVVIEGKELTGWEGVTIDMAVDHVADAFSITAPWDPDRKELQDAFRGYNHVEIWIDEKKYLTGRIDKADPDLESSDRKINIQGRSLTGILVDCSHDGEAVYNNLALSTLCRQVCKPFGLKVRADNDTAPILECRPEYGQKAADFLNSVAAPRNILLNCSYLGELVLTWSNALITKAPCARLIEGEWPVESVGGSRDWTKLYSIYQVATQFAGVPDVIDTARDKNVQIYRPLFMSGMDAVQSPEDQAALDTLESEFAEAKGETAAQTKSKMMKARTAARLRAQAIAEACPISVKVTGWRRPDGQRWAERQIVTLKAPSAMVYEEIPFLISGARFSLDVSGGRSVTLNLVLPETFAGVLPKDAGKIWG
jgi:prophage tail gpP-like protein